MYTIDTARLKLVSCDSKMLSMLIEDSTRFESYYNLCLELNWTSFGMDPLNYSLTQLADPAQANWWTYLPVIKNGNSVIGTCGFKGKPNESNIVEIGYEVAPAFRRNAYGLEIAQALIREAFHKHHVSAVIAHTLAEENASTAILKNCGMKFIAAMEDPEDGLIWKWQLDRSI